MITSAGARWLKAQKLKLAEINSAAAYCFAVAAAHSAAVNQAAAPDASLIAAHYYLPEADLAAADQTAALLPPALRFAAKGCGIPEA